ncbi:hypothetical protein HDV00_004913 [Rhizophlyctis rosea]|nr:hypothetical protein HDV00_004913 [Rhizophlyctis rosea]
MQGRPVPSHVLPQLSDDVAYVVAETYSDKFHVYAAKKFPGMEESTELSKCFARQGVKIPIRNELRQRQRKSASGIGIKQEQSEVSEHDEPPRSASGGSGASADPLALTKGADETFDLVGGEEEGDADGDGDEEAGEGGDVGKGKGKAKR